MFYHKLYSMNFRFNFESQSWAILFLDLNMNIVYSYPVNMQNSSHGGELGKRVKILALFGYSLDPFPSQ